MDRLLIINKYTMTVRRGTLVEAARLTDQPEYYIEAEIILRGRFDDGYVTVIKEGEVVA